MKPGVLPADAASAMDVSGSWGATFLRAIGKTQEALDAQAYAASILRVSSFDATRYGYGDIAGPYTPAVEFQLHFQRQRAGRYLPLAGRIRRTGDAAQPDLRHHATVVRVSVAVRMPLLLERAVRIITPGVWIAAGVCSWPSVSAATVADIDWHWPRSMPMRGVPAHPMESAPHTLRSRQLAGEESLSLRRWLQDREGSGAWDHPGYSCSSLLEERVSGRGCPVDPLATADLAWFLKRFLR